MNEFQEFVKHLKLEAFALALLMVVLTYYSPAPLWILPATFLIFDIGAIGYLKNSKFGALTYNLSHGLTIPTLLLCAELMFHTDWISVIGYCWILHVAVDRALGFGLKHNDSFRKTHLGQIGKNI